MSVLYSVIRGGLKTGDLVSWKTEKITSFFTFVLYIYQKILKPKSTHVGIVINIGGRILVVEAIPPAVRIYPLSMLDNFYYINTNVKQKNSNLDILLREVGVSYGAFDLIKGILLNNKDGDELYCSELAFNFYNEVGLLNDIKYENAGRLPDDLIKAIEEVTGKTFTYVTIDKENLDII